MKIQKFSNYVNEKMDFKDIEERMGDDYKDLKNGIVDKIKDTLESTKEANLTITDVEDFISDYLSVGKEANMINGVIEDNDVFNFYLKYQTDIDQLLNDKGYMDESPKKHNVFSLYDVIIDGTKQSIIESIKLIQKEIFKK